MENNSRQSLWQHRDYTRFWIAGTVSNVGDQFTGLAIPLIAAIMLHASPAQMGLLTALNGAPFVLFSLFAGVWTDRMARRPMLIACDFGRAILLLTIPAASFLGMLTMDQLYAVELGVGTMNVFFQVAHQAYLPSLIERRQLVEGNSRMVASSSVARLAGPSVAGTVIEFLSAPIAVILDALSFVVSAAYLYRIRQPEIRPKQISVAPMLKEIRVGFSTVFGNPLLKAVGACIGSTNFFDSALMTLFVLFATRELHLGPAQIGLILGVGSASGFIGAVSAERAVRWFGLGRVIVWGVLIYSIGIVPVVLARPNNAYAFIIGGFLVSSLAVPIFSINQLSLRQVITPPHLLGRMNATMRFLNTGPMPLGGLAAGLLGEAIGLRPAITLIVIGGLTSFLWVYFSPVRHLRDFPAPAD